MEGEQAEGDQLNTSQEHASNAEHIAKIKKKAPVTEEEADDDEVPTLSQEASQDIMTAETIRQQEHKARRELVDFLVRKGVDPHAADEYQIHIRQSKVKARRYDASSPPGPAFTYSVTYSGPEGSILMSKSDVLSTISDRKSRHSASQLKASNGKGVPSRTAAYENARQHLADKTEDGFPLQAEKILIHTLGEIDPRSGFHSSVQIYPVGYRAEQVVHGTTYYKGTTSQKIICEIGDLDGYPEFRIIIPGTGTTFLASSEAAVWKKYNPGNVDAEWDPSFFNLEVELLIEGLDGADLCEDYKFHEERGYGVDYHDEAEAKVARNAYQAKASRERRNQERQRARHLSKEDQQRQLELTRRRTEEEKDLSKRLLVLEKEKKDQLREDFKKKKDEQKEVDKKSRESRKQMDSKQREALKLMEVEKREQQRMSEKSMKEKQKKTMQFRKDVLAEVKKNRSVASMSVVDCFDAEEVSEEISSVNVDVLTSLPTGSPTELLQGHENLQAYIRSLSSLPDLEESSSRYHTKASWDDVMSIANTLNIFKSVLGIDKKVDFAQLVATLSGNINPNEATKLLSNVLATPNAMDVDDNNAAEALLANREADLDRIQLSITKTLLTNLHSLLDMDQRESSDASGRKDKRMAAVKYPLNQLTWLELARMSCLSYLFAQPLRSHEDVRAKEDIQHLLRGSKQSSFRIAKNIVRNIRYRWYVLTKMPHHISNAKSSLYEGQDDIDAEDQMELISNLVATRNLSEKDAQSLVIHNGPRIYGQPAGQINQQRAVLRPPINAFNNEVELLQTLQTVSEDEKYSETYRRCCKVLIKILNTSAAKNLIWEVDQELYPDYYSTITRPVMFTNVASSLVNKAYDHVLDGGLSGFDYKIAYEFYKDLQQVAINCITYNSEVSPMISQAQKLLQLVHRHVHRWLLNVHLTASSPPPPGVYNYTPPLEYCSDKYCLLTYTTINYNYNECIKCGKCQGCYNISALENAYLSSNYDLITVGNKEEMDFFREFYVHPTPEILAQVNEEWHCPFCLQEDSTLLYAGLPASLQDKVKNTTFFINEYGPSATIPWLFNDLHCRTGESMVAEQPFLLPIIDALNILTNTSLTSFAGENGMKSWSVAERARVLMALCIISKDTASACIGVMGKLFSHCEKLMELCNKAQFREADFIGIVRKIAGDEGVIQCRNLLDGITNQDKSRKVSNTEESYLQSIITEGRCILCNASTYIDDENNDELGNGHSHDPVILCDGCNAEVHLRCLNLDEVPSEEWYCATCSERNAKRDQVRDPVLDMAESSRHKKEEDVLLDQCAESKAEGLNPFSASSAEDEMKCQYCGFTNKELCSVMVTGQSRSEHDAWIQSCLGACVHGVLDNKRDTAVRFYHEGELMHPPELDYPYFFTTRGKAGKTMCEEYVKAGQEPVIVHDFCAVHMFHARVNRIKHTLRRRRKVVGQKAISMCGISVQPLGYDDKHFEYWKFPFSSDLFICYHPHGHPVDADQAAFNKLLKKHESMDGVSGLDHSKVWVRVSDVEVMKTIVACLGNSFQEASLKKNILTDVLSDRALVPAGAAPKSIPTRTSVSNISDQVDDEEQQQEEQAEDQEEAEEEEEVEESKLRNGSRISSPDSTPCGLKLFPSKGQDISEHYHIQEEKVFEDDDEMKEEDEDAEEASHYFTFSKRNRFYAVGLTSARGSMVKMNSVYKKYNLKVVSQIHREGIATPLSYAELSEPWTDHMYYFSSINFKKSGRYTISFIVEGSSAGSIKPLIYPITVTANRVRCGISDAVERLNARAYLQSNNRQIVQGRRELLALTHSTADEMSAVKAILISIYLAMPAGCLSMDTNAANDEDLDTLLEPTGWNSVVEQTWRGAVIRAESPLSLMECLLVLEFYINRSWLTAPHSRLVQSLPNAHFAIRCVTYSSVALRVYCLDKAIAYDKALSLPRERREARAQGLMDEEDYSKTRTSRYVSRTGDDSSRRSRYSEEAVRPSRRAASTNASARIQRQTSDTTNEAEGEEDENYDDDDDDSDDDDAETVQEDAEDNVEQEEEVAPSGPDDWACPACSTRNEPRARSCSTCGERKPAVSARGRAAKQQAVQRTRPIRQIKKRVRDDSDSDEAEFDDSINFRRTRDDDSDEESGKRTRRGRRASRDSDDDEASPRHKPSLRAKGRGRSYAELSEEEEEDEPHNVRKRGRHSEDVPSDDAQAEYLAYVRNLPGEVKVFGDRIAEYHQSSKGEASTDVHVRALSVLRKLLVNVKSQLFWAPVDLALVPSYSLYIDEPMDLGTITERIYANYYQGDKDKIAKDIRLVWSNCSTFNGEGSPLHAYAAELSALFEGMWAQWVELPSRPSYPDIE